MPRPQEPEKKQQLARRAAGVLERHGLSISAEQLARELGIKRPTLLYHFPTYGHILEAVLGQLLLEQIEFVDERVQAHEHPLDRMFARLKAVHEFQQGREAHVLFLTQAIAATGGARLAEILSAAAGLFDGQRREMAGQLEAGMKQGVVRRCDAAALVTLLRAIIDGLTVQRVASVSPTLLEPIHELVWDHLLGPLKIEPKRRPPARKVRATTSRPRKKLP